MSQWWIELPKIQGSSNPTTDELRVLYTKGFRTVISLLDENQQHPYYNLDEAEAMGFDRVTIPIRDFRAPTQNQFNRFLNTVNKARVNGKVIMHCQGGCGRTGTMAAAYWIDKGLSAKEAIDRVRKSRLQAVETTEQEKSLHKLQIRMSGLHGRLPEDKS